MKIAAVTVVRNDSHFTARWVAHYGAQIGLENLYVICRGADWPLPDLPAPVSRLVVSGTPVSRSARDDWAARHTSDFVAFLLQSHDAVIRADADEFLVADPALGLTLAEGIAAARDLGCVSALGTDVIHHLDLEGPLDHAAPILAQRRHGIVTREFSKPAVVFHPVRWGAGFHRADGQELRFGPGLHLFHLALHDRDVAEARVAERGSAATSASLQSHVEGRLARFAEITAAAPLPGDDIYDSARAQIAAPRGNGTPRTRPGHITDGHNTERGFLIEIPARFAQML